MVIQKETIIVSASRRTDMVAGKPEHLIERLSDVQEQFHVHSLVIWTKDPSNILYHTALNSKLKSFDQLFILLSITGLGASELEPGVPEPDEVISVLPELVKIVKDPRRIRVRFDPIVHFKMPDNRVVCNLDFFETLAPAIIEHGIDHVITSWVQIYPKVIKRLKQRGITALKVDHEQWSYEAEWLQEIAAKYNIHLHGCCVPGWPQSRCIDGYLLNNLHPKSYIVTTRKASGQRPLCGCTKSKDIGWYHKCPNGCIYCYGNPAIL